MQKLNVAVIGFGEAGMTFSANWSRDHLARIKAFDIKIEKPNEHANIQQRGRDCRVEIEETLRDAVSDADIIFSFVTADCASQAASNAAPHLQKHALYFDCNSCSPNTKKQSAARLEARGIGYIDVAVMAPVQPKKAQTPLLISGPSANNALDILTKLGMCATIAGEQIGQASSIKMLRSIMIKGIEALSAEAMLSAHRAGVSDKVLASLQASDPGIPWQSRSAYNLERMMVHGIRRAAEMREVIQTVEELGLPAPMAKAITQWQDTIGQLHLEPTSEDLSVRAEQILTALETSHSFAK